MNMYYSFEGVSTGYEVRLFVDHKLKQFYYYPDIDNACARVKLLVNGGIRRVDKDGE